MNIHKLSIKNFKRLTGLEVVVDPEGLVVIGGRNAQGKSSVLDAIAFLLGGPKFRPSEPLHRGADGGRVTVELDGGITVTRTMTAKGGGSLRIATSDGMSPSKPQAWLDARLGALTFDPLAFMRLPPKAQATVLRELTGCDTSQLDAERKRVFDDRRDVGRDAKRARAHADELPHHEGAERVDVHEITQQIQRAEAQVAEIERMGYEARSEANKAASFDGMVDTASRDAAAWRQRADAQPAVDSLAAQLAERLATIEAEAEAEIEQVRRRAVERAEQARSANTVASAAARARAAEAEERARDAEWQAKSDRKLADEARARADEWAAKQLAATEAAAQGPSLSDLRHMLATAASNNALADANDRKAAAMAEADKLAASYAAHTQRLSEIDDERRAMLDAVAFPVDGLGFGDSGVTFRGLPLGQASQAEQIRIGMEIALASDPAVRIALIRDGSLLDDEHLQLVAEIATARGAQVWVERVGDNDDGAIIIEDGAQRA